MLHRSVYLIAAAVMAVWGGFVATLIGWAIYGTVANWLAAMFPRRFPKAAHGIYMRKLRKVRTLDRRRAKEAFNRRMPPEYSEACRNAIIELIERGPCKDQPKPNRKRLKAIR